MSCNRNQIRRTIQIDEEVKLEVGRTSTYSVHSLNELNALISRENWLTDTTIEIPEISTKIKQKASYEHVLIDFASSRVDCNGASINMRNFQIFISFELFTVSRPLKTV